MLARNFSLIALTVAVASIACSRLSSAAQATRELVLSSGIAEQWMGEPGITLKNADGKTRATVSQSGAAFTLINLPPTTTRILFDLSSEEKDRGKIESLLCDVHGWTNRRSIASESGVEYLDDPLNAKTGWSWRTGFFKSAPEGPFQFHGLLFHGQESKNSAAKAIEIAIGPIRAIYTPDDSHWLYTDLQPKTLASNAGSLPPIKLRVANLGTRDRTFKLSVRPVERNERSLPGEAVSAGSVSLAAGELKELTLRVPIQLLGRYRIALEADGQDGSAIERETVSVVNGMEKADAFRDWSSRRKWFDAKQRRLAAELKEGQAVPSTLADNGISVVSIFPVQARKPLTLPTTPASDATFGVITSQLSPAWLIHGRETKLNLFTGTTANGLGAPSRLAFATADGTRIVPGGTTLSTDELKQMSRGWLLVWWQGAKGWDKWDAPHLVSLQHRPTGMTLDDMGLSLTFDRSADYVSVLPLYGCAKLPQQGAFEKNPADFHLPADWPARDLRTWTWDKQLPASVRGQCDLWSRLLLKFPWNVRETYTIDHAGGAIKVRDDFDYIDINNDWQTEPLAIAPLSPTLAVARAGGYPLAVEGEVVDLHYPTLYGPYTGIKGAAQINYRMDIGPYLMQAADANLTRPDDLLTPARRAQAELLNGAHSSDDVMENQAWDFRDGNFVWTVQQDDFRFAARLTDYVDAPSRQDRKRWLQARALDTLLDPTRYKIDERGQLGFTRRYIDGPGIGNWGAADWGDSGKLGTDMIYNAWVYAYATGDYQTIADRWDFITSLNVAPITMTWLGVGRTAIAETGDEAPPQLALARLAFAVGDRQTYAAAAYWYARELVHHTVKDGGFTVWREQFKPWHRLLEGPCETPTNLWGNNAGWVGGGLHTAEKGENQWNNFYVRLDDPDVLRFHREHALLLPRRIVPSSTDKDREGNFPIFFDRVALLGQDPESPRAEFIRDANKPRPMPDTWLTRAAVSWKEFKPSMQTLIPPESPPISDEGFAWDQMNECSVAMVSPSEMPSRTPPALTWFWDDAPQRTAGDGGDKWTFGRVSIPGMASDTVGRPLGCVATDYEHRSTPGATAGQK